MSDSTSIRSESILKPALINSLLARLNTCTYDLSCPCYSIFVSC